MKPLCMEKRAESPSSRPAGLISSYQKCLVALIATHQDLKIKVRVLLPLRDILNCIIFLKKLMIDHTISIAYLFNSVLLIYF